MTTQLSTFKIAFLLISVFSVFSFSLVSCDKSDTEPDTEQVLEANLLKSASKYADVISRRQSGSDQKFTIENIQRDGDLLKVLVKGGCSADAFKIIWDGSIMHSYPAQIRLVLVHESDNTHCSTTDEFVVPVNLKKIIGTQDQSDFIFHVANGSLKEDKSLNPNGSVSSH